MALRIGPGRKEGRAWWKRLACERAIALPMAVMAMMVVMLLASAAGTAAISAMGQSNHDGGTKRAVAAADAGLDTAIYRLNKLQPSALYCVVEGPLHLLLDPILGTGWCPVVTTQLAGGSGGSEQLGGGASFSYQMSAGQNLTVSGQSQQQRKIVVTGTANGVSRRVMANVATLTGVSAFGGNALTSLEDFTLPLGTTVIGGVASNEDVSAAICTQIVGNSWYGGTFDAGGQDDCPIFAQEPLPQPLVLNPVLPKPQDSNTRINSGGQDPFTLRFLSSWSESTRVLHVRSGSTLTLTGNTYSFCKVTVDSLGQLIIAPRLSTQEPVRIYIDSPENCSGVTNAGTMTVSGSGMLTNLNATPNTLQISALGSPGTGEPPAVLLDGTTPSNVIGLIYAPQSEVRITRANAVLGAVAGERVTLLNTARIQWHPSADVTLDDLSPLFKRTNWVECTSEPTGSAPDSGC